MPKIIKKKTLKKRPVDESEVKSAARQALEKIRERQRHLIIGTSVIAALVLLFLALSLYSTSRYKKASSLEQEASMHYYGERVSTSMPEGERLTKALELFQNAIDVKVTPINLFYLGNTYFKLNDYENAIKQYTRFTAKFSSEKAIMPLVYQKLASSYFKTGDTEAALNALATLAALDSGIYRDTALLLEARHLEGAGKKEGALEKYREIFTLYPSSPWAAEASAKVSAEEAKKEGDASESAAEPSDKEADQPKKQEELSATGQDADVKKENPAAPQ